MLVRTLQWRANLIQLLEAGSFSGLIPEGIEQVNCSLEGADLRHPQSTVPTQPICDKLLDQIFTRQESRMAQKPTRKAISKRKTVAAKAVKKASKAKGAAKKPVKSAARKTVAKKVSAAASKRTSAKKVPAKKVKAKAKKPSIKVSSKKSKPSARKVANSTLAKKAASRTPAKNAAPPKKIALAKIPKTTKPPSQAAAHDIAAARASAAAVSELPHPGMMGDGTEEQNLNQPGVPGARITGEDVEAAFGESKPDSN
jgi:hypothetical protein